MNKIAFSPADILLPVDCGLAKWAVVACDQYTSQPEYWERVDKYVGDAPSTLRLILPESKLESDNVEEEIQKINETMTKYLEEDRLRPLNNALLYIERKLDNGKVRYGLIGKLDLEQYDYSKGSGTPVRATEGTVLERIPPRMRVRRNAPIELPHIMVLIDDPDKNIIEPLHDQKKNMSMVYKTTLMERGGQIEGWLLDNQQAKEVIDKMSVLADPDRFAKFYHAEGYPVLTFAMGDGNHSLATAKRCYEELKAVTPPEQWTDLPARYALVEVVNNHDEALQFEPIHRVLFGADPETFLAEFRKQYPNAYEGKGEGHAIEVVWAGHDGFVTVPDPELQLTVGTLQSFLDGYVRAHGGEVDYIHGDDVARELGKKEGNMAFLLPAMGKAQLFKTVMADGVLPRKTFSMGHAQDKRYYVEARRIR